MAVVRSVAGRYREGCESYLEVIPTLSLMAGTVCAGLGRDPAYGWHLINAGRMDAYERNPVVSRVMEKKIHKTVDLPPELCV